MQDVLQDFSFDGIFRLKQAQKLLYELGSAIRLEHGIGDSIVEQDSKENFIDAFDVHPGWIEDLLQFDSSFFLVKVNPFEARKRPKYILRYH